MQTIALVVLGVLLFAGVIGWLIRRSKGPKAAPVNPFDRVQSSRKPAFPEGDAASSSSSDSATASDTNSPAAQTGNSVMGAKPEPEVEEEPMTIAKYLAQAEQEVKDADLDSAIDTVGEAIDLATTESGGESLAVAALYLKQGQLYQLRDYQDDSDGLNCAEYLRALALTEINLGPNAEELQPVLKALVSWYYQNGLPDKADQLIRRSQSVTDFVANAQREVASRNDGSVYAPPAARLSPIKLPFTSTIEDAVNSCKEGDDAFVAGEYDDAMSAYGSAIESVQTEIGRDAPELALLFHRLSRAHFVSQANELDDEGKPSYSDPADNCQIALGLVVADKGFNAPEVEQLLLDLAAYEDLCGEHYKAESYLRRLSDIERIKRSAR